MEEDRLRELFPPGQSPYFGMYRAGVEGIPLERVINRLSKMGIPVREKDVQNWENGMFRNQMRLNPIYVERPVITETGVPFDDSSLSDFPFLPEAFHKGCLTRFFPCNSKGAPMERWGYRPDFAPMLHTYEDAMSLSPRGWVGQNMLGQPFIVIDVDGVGHGCVDHEAIAFGSAYKQSTLCMEDPRKPGSFHLYFATKRQIPLRHFPWAKIDLMGNTRNAAVYMKDKVSNGVPMAPLEDEFWRALMAYQKTRKERIA